MSEASSDLVEPPIKRLKKDSITSSDKFATPTNDSSAMSSSISQSTDTPLTFEEKTIAARSVIQERRLVFSRERVNLESHQLIWFDTNVNSLTTSERAFIVDRLRKVVDYTKLFDNCKDCREFIESTKGVVTFVVFSVTIRITHDWHPPILNEVGRQNNTAENYVLGWWRHFVIMLCHLPYPEGARETLTIALRQYYQDMDAKLRAIDEFERTYTPGKAVWWYTRDTFLYRLLNKALRQHNIEVMFLFGFYIKDIYHQLKNEHREFKNSHSDQPIVTAYRGQLMSSEEIEKIQMFSTTGIVINSFFSTTLDRQVAKFQLDPTVQGDNQLKSVLLEIELDIRNQSLPYGDISSLSSFSSEQEILLMIGTHLETVEVTHDKDKDIYSVKLTLTDDLSLTEDGDLNVTTMKATVNSCLKQAANELCKATLEEIKTIFIELSELYPSEKSWLVAVKHYFMGAHYRLWERVEGEDEKEENEEKELLAENNM
ncbi:unnamed protein product [Didymodactylos carnosus]|uniref:Uncharacterized protein n=1 Tax=Didymodactylos carnosus TaxID=1234261 RepID=A0A814UJ38_9BILA|nr:unnamed protein product [Didymodactylos carnosus]CAF3941891.1 unnamed protein product [Didymodactylos carnosus]